MNEILKAASYWTRMGVAVIPVEYKGKRPVVRWLDYATQLPDEDQIGRWFASRYTNIAVVSGWKNLVVLDFDDAEAYIKWMCWAMQVKGPAQTVAMHTRMEYSNRGVHLYLFTVKRADNMKLPGIDVLADRKYCICAPSVHPSGKSYTLVRDTYPVTVESIRDLFPAEVLASAEQCKPVAVDRPAVPVTVDAWSMAGGGGSSVSLVADIRAKIHIEDFFSEKYSTGDGWYVVRCPFHNDHSPSMWIDARRGLCGCHSCGFKPMDVINFYASLHGLDNATAIKDLRQRLV